MIGLWLKIINVTALVGYLFWGCGLFTLGVDDAEDKEPVDASTQRVLWCRVLLSCCVQPGSAHEFASFVWRWVQQLEQLEEIECFTLNTSYYWRAMWPAVWFINGKKKGSPRQSTFNCYRFSFFSYKKLSGLNKQTLEHLCLCLCVCYILMV